MRIPVPGPVAGVPRSGLRALLGRRAAPAGSGFRDGPLWAWCPAERRQTPHGLDAGVRFCRVCKTPTTTSQETAHG